MKLLVCSPSNGGCDELARRLKHDIDKDLIQVGDKEFALVRIGRMESIHGDCESIMIDRLVKKKAITFERSDSLTNHYKDLEIKEKNIKNKIDIAKSSSNYAFVSFM